MQPTLLTETLTARFKNHVRRAVHIEGSPGLGKTQIVAQVAKELGVGFRIIHAPLMQPEDYGMPIVNAARDGVKFVVPTEKFPMEGTDCEERGILLLDELPQSDNASQKILANLVQEREIHGQKIKDGWMIVSTGNRAADRAGANRILSHLRNRMTTYEFEPHLDDWCGWAIDNDVNPELISFIRFRPNLLSEFNASREINPTPRAWVEGVNASLGKVPPSAEYETFKGDVGEGATGEFLAFLKIYRKLPNPDVVLMNPDKHDLPTDPATLYALCGALSARATAVNADRIVTVAKRMQPEFMVLCLRDSVRKCPDFQRTKAFSQWAAREGAKILT